MQGKATPTNMADVATRLRAVATRLEPDDLLRIACVTLADALTRRVEWYGDVHVGHEGEATLLAFAPRAQLSLVTNHEGGHVVA